MILEMKNPPELKRLTHSGVMFICRTRTHYNSVQVARPTNGKLSRLLSMIDDAFKMALKIAGLTRLNTFSKCTSIAR